MFPELHLSGYAIGATDRDASLAAEDPRLAELARAATPSAVVLGFPELRAAAASITAPRI